MRKAGIVATAATLGLGLSALPATADEADDKARDKTLSEALAEARAQEREVRNLQHAKMYRGKRITTVNLPACVGGVGVEANLVDAWVAANASATSIHNIVLGSNCTYTLTAGLATMTAARQVMITGSNSTIVAFATTRHFTTIATSTLRLYGVTLRGTGAAATGGITNPGTLSTYNTTITLNQVAANGGGITNTGTASIYNSTISSNSAGAEGGGISSAGGSLLVYNSRVSSNTAVTNGGGIFSANGLTTLTNSLISSNSAGAAGGGTYNGALGLLNAYGSLWSGNSAATTGGAISSVDSFYGRLIGLTGNNAVTGGGYYNGADTDALVTLSGGYVNTNNATTGGGIYNIAPNTVTQANVSGTTVSGNTPSDCTNVTGC